MTETPLSVAIMACPQRCEHAYALQEALQAQTSAPVRLVVDYTRRGPRFCAARAWGLTGTSGHHLVIQDDAVLCKDFLDGVSEAVAQAPDALLSLFSTRLRSTPDCARLERISHLVGAVALVAPVHVACDLAAYLDARTEFVSDDAAIARYLMETSQRAYVTVPNLVDHAQLPSTMNHPPMRSASFLGQNQSAVGLEWVLHE